MADLGRRRNGGFGETKRRSGHTLQHISVESSSAASWCATMKNSSAIGAISMGSLGHTGVW